MPKGSTLAICHDGRVVVVPSGVFVVKDPVSVPIDLSSLAAALNVPPLSGIAVVHPGPGAERSPVLLRYLAGLDSRVRDYLVVLPPAGVLASADVDELTELADIYGLALLLPGPAGSMLARSDRAIPLDADGRRTTWERPAWVRLSTNPPAPGRTPGPANGAELLPPAQVARLFDGLAEAARPAGDGGWDDRVRTVVRVDGELAARSWDSVAGPWFSAAGGVAPRPVSLASWFAPPISDYQPVVEAMWAAPPGARGLLGIRDGTRWQLVNVVRADGGVAVLGGSELRPDEVRFLPLTDGIVAESGEPTPLVDELSDAQLARLVDLAIHGGGPLTVTEALAVTAAPVTREQLVDRRTTLDAGEDRDRLPAIDTRLVQTLQPLRGQLTEELSRHTQAIERAGEQLQQHRDELARLAGESGRLRRELRAYAGVVRDLRTDLSAAQRALGDLDREHERLDGDRKAAAEAYQEAAEAYRIAERAYRETEGAAEPSRAILDERARRLTGATAALDEHAGRVARQRELASRTADQLAAAQTEVNAAQDWIAQLRNERQTVTAALDTVAQVRSAAIDARNSTRTRLEAVQASIAEATARAARIADLQLIEAQTRAARVTLVGAGETAGTAAADDALRRLEQLRGRGLAGLTDDDVAHLGYLIHLREALDRAGVEAAERPIRDRVARIARHSSRPIADDAVDSLVASEQSYATLHRLSELLAKHRPAATAHRDDVRARLAAAGEGRARLVDTVLGPDVLDEERFVALAETAQWEAGADKVVAVLDQPYEPWFARELHVLGDGFVREVGELPEALRTRLFGGLDGLFVSSDKRKLTKPPAQLKPFVAKLKGLLGGTDRRAWEKLVLTGETAEIGGRFVRVYARPGAMTFRAPQGDPDPGVVSTRPRYGDTTAARFRGGKSEWGGDALLTAIWAATGEVLNQVIGPILRLSVGGGRSWRETVARERQSGTRILANDMHDFTADVHIVIEVDGREVAAHPLPGHLLVSLPQAFSTAVDAYDTTQTWEPTEVRNPAALQHEDYAVNAGDFTAFLASLNAGLRDQLKLTDAQAAKVVHEFRTEMLNERRGKDRQQWWTTDAWTSPLVDVSVGGHKRFSGYLTGGGRITELRRITRIPPNVIRNDIAGTTTRRARRGFLSKVGFRVGVELPLHQPDAVVMPRVDLLNFASSADDNRAVSAQSQTKVATMRKEELVRYRVGVEMSMRLHSSFGTLTVNGPVTTELAVGASRAAIFETSAAADPVLAKVATFPGLPRVRSKWNPQRWYMAASNPRSRVGSALRAPFAGKGPPRPFASRGDRGIVELRAAARRGPIGLSIPGPELPAGWEWAAGHPSVTVRPEGEFGFPPAARFSYHLDAAGRVLGAWRLGPPPASVATRMPVEYVPNPALRGRSAPPADPLAPFPANGLTGIGDLLVTAAYGPIELAIEGGVLPPHLALLAHRRSRADRAGHTSPTLADNLRVRELRSLTYPPAAATDAAFRYVLNPLGQVLGGYPLGPIEERADGVRTRALGAYVPNPAYHRTPPTLVIPAPQPTGEPVELITGRGLGPGVIKEMPGAELILPTVLNVLQKAVETRGLPMSPAERQQRALELALKYGVPGLRGEQRTLYDGSILDVYQLGGYTFRTNVSARLGDLRDQSTEPDITLDVQGKGTAGYAVDQGASSDAGVALDIGVKAMFGDAAGLRASVLQLLYRYKRGRRIALDNAFKEYRRRKTSGDVRKFTHTTTYDVIMTVSDPDGRVSELTRLAYGGKDFTVAVRVALEDLEPVPVPVPQPLLGTDRLAEVTKAEADEIQAWLAGSDAAGSRVRGLDEGINGVYVWLNDVRAVAGYAETFVANARRRLGVAEAPHADVAKTLAATAGAAGARHFMDGALADVLTPGFLEPHAEEAVSRTGYLIRLDEIDGWTHALRVHLVPVNPRFVRAVKDAAHEQYAEADNRVVHAARTAHQVPVEFGPAVVAKIPGGGGADDAHQDHQVTSTSGNYFSAGAAYEYTVEQAHERSELSGGLVLNMASYSGRSFRHRMDAIYVLTYVRYRKGDLRPPVTAMIKVHDGMQTSVPESLVADYGLPLPPTERPTAPPVSSPRVPIHQEVAFAAGAVEKLDARRVLPAVKAGLTALNVDLADPDLAGAVEAVFRSDAIRAGYGTARRDGLFQLINLPARGRMRYVLVRVRAADGPLVYERPRPDAKSTIGGQAFTQDREASARENAHAVKLHADGRGTAPDGTRVAAGTKASLETKQVAEHVKTDTVRDIRRATTTESDSQQFRAGTRFTIEFFETSRLAEAVDLPWRLLKSGVGVVDSISDGRLRAQWQRWFDPTKRPARTDDVPGGLRLLVPSHLTTWPGRQWVDLPPTAGPPVRWPAATIEIRPGAPPAGSDTAARFSVEVAKSIQVLDSYGLDVFARWLPATTLRGPGRYDPSHPPSVPGYQPMSLAGLAIQLRLNQANVKTTAPGLLRGDALSVGAGQDFPVRMILTKGRWLARGNYDGLNFPEHSSEPEHKRESSTGWQVQPLQVELGQGSGDDRITGGAVPAVGGKRDRGGENSLADYLEENELYKGAKDYYWFDVTMVSAAKNGKNHLHADLPYGLIGLIPVALTEKYRAAFPGILDAPQPVRHTQDVTAPGLLQDATQRLDAVSAAKKLLTAPGRSDARLTAWTRLVEPARPATTPDDPVDGRTRAYGAFVALHGRLTNAVVDAGILEHPTLDNLLAALGGRLAELPDADRLWDALESRPGFMALVHATPVGAKMPRVFWMASRPDGIRWLDSQQPGLLDRPAVRGSVRGYLTGKLTDRHTAMLRSPGTRVLVLDRAGRPVDLAGLLAGQLPDRGLDEVLVRPPAGAAWQGRLLRLGSFTASAAQRLDLMVPRLAGLRRPVIAVNAPAGEAGAMTGLRGVLRAYAQLGVHPVVLPMALSSAQGVFEELRNEFKPVVIRWTTGGSLDNAMELVAPDGTVSRFAEGATAELFGGADGAPATPTGHQLPAVAARWLALHDWDDRHRFLVRHWAELSGIAPGEPRGGLAGPLRTVWDLVKRNGGPAPASIGRSAGPPDTNLMHLSDLSAERVDELGWDGRLPETFVIDVLRTSLPLRQREPWIGELVRLMDVRTPVGRIRGLTPGEVATLIASTGDEDAEAMGKVFAAVAEALLLSPDEVGRVAAHLTKTGAVAPGTAFGAALRDIQTCAVSPAARAALVAPLTYLRNRLGANGRQTHGDLVEHVLLTMIHC